jgi:hypothetical protein
MENAPVAEPTSPPVDAARTQVDEGGACPFPHGMLPESAGCPVPHGAGTTTKAPPATRSAADLWVRKVLRIKERPTHITEAAANSAFQKSMLISATRCTLTYVIFPFVLPVLGIASGVGPLLGLTIGSIAIVCDVFAIRRFFAADHRYRWYFSAIALSIIGLLAVLLVQDLSHLVT